MHGVPHSGDSSPVWLVPHIRPDCPYLDHRVWSLPTTVPSAGLAVFSKILIKINSSNLNACDFTHWLCRFANFCWYDDMDIAVAFQSLSVVSRSLVIASPFASSEISVRMVGIPIFVKMIASIPNVRANGDSPVGFR